MESYQNNSTLDSSDDSIREHAFKYDAGVIKSRKYGKATLSGHLLLVNPAEIPPINEKQIEENARVWLNNMELGKFQEQLIAKQRIHMLLAYTARGLDPNELELCFRLDIFGTLIDDSVSRLNHLTENNPIKNREEMVSLIENMNFIIENHGDKNVTQAAISKVNPLFKYACLALSYTCSQGYEKMGENDYKHFAEELFQYIMTNKWMMDIKYFPYKHDQFLELRVVDLYLSPPAFGIFLVKNIRICRQITIHPVFRRYYKNIILHMVIVNDILSLVKEVAESDNDNFNSVLRNCQNYSLQKSIHMAEKAANDLFIDLKKDKMMLLTYFPTNEGLKNFIKTIEYVTNGAMTWYTDTGRYGSMKFEACMVEYHCDFNSWLQQLDSIDVSTMREPRFSSQPDNGAIPSLFT